MAACIRVEAEKQRKPAMGEESKGQGNDEEMKEQTKTPVPRHKKTEPKLMS